MRNSDEKGRVAVITGATKGLGKALSFAFATAGYEVIGVYRSDSGNAEIIESEFKDKKLPGCFIRQDITEDGNWIEFDEIVEANRNKHFTLIANASSPFIPKPFHLIDWTEISEQLEVNVRGTFLIFRRLLPKMIKNRGTFITVLSSVLDLPPKGFAAYLVAKSALEGLTKAAAAEYSDRGLRVFSVSPGFMKTSLTSTWSTHLIAVLAQKTSIQRPDDTAQAILDLTEDSNNLGNGENYSLDTMQ
jgi:3-oxoacyl-[acyl-carrier protein] reductase